MDARRPLAYERGVDARAESARRVAGELAGQARETRARTMEARLIAQEQRFAGHSAAARRRALVADLVGDMGGDGLEPPTPSV